MLNTHKIPILRKLKSFKNINYQKNYRRIRGNICQQKNMKARRRKNEI